MKTILIILLILTSCATTRKRHHREPLHFFACRTWIDDNHDGIYDSSEFKDIKDTFHSSESVMFVGFFADLPIGTHLRFSLYSPDGSLVREVSEQLVYRKTLLHSEYPVGELIGEKSEGVWEAVWDVENEVVAEVEVKFVR